MASAQAKKAAALAAAATASQKPAEASAPGEAAKPQGDTEASASSAEASAADETGGAHTAPEGSATEAAEQSAASATTEVQPAIPDEAIAEAASAEPELVDVGLATATDAGMPGLAGAATLQDAVISLLGSSIQPSIIDLGNDVTVQLGVVVVHAAGQLRLSPAEWNALDDVKREAWIARAIEDLADDVRWPRDPILVVVTSRDEQPYRRCGQTWSAVPEPAAVHPLVAARLEADPFLLVRRIEPVSEA